MTERALDVLRAGPVSFRAVPVGDDDMTLEETVDLF
ncbi:hypothetical protein ABH927_001931 [Planotetraspora sp. GP83]